MTTQKQSLTQWKRNIDKILLIIMLAIFLCYAGYMAVNLEFGIIPDEPAHLAFSKHFATTWGIPEDTYETFRWGWYIQGNPFLYYWINGRVINLLTLLRPSINERDVQVGLRLVNVLYALGTSIFCYLLAGVVFQSKWWRLLPVFLLTNTLMFVFLSAGVNYDNLANLLSMAGLFFLVRVFNHKNFWTNSLAWMIMIALGALVKYTVLPLALAMAVAWLVFTIINRKKVIPVNLNNISTIILIIILAGLLSGNFAIYGMNLLRYQTLTTPCLEILAEDQCAISPYVKREQSIALDPELSIAESISQGYPSPLEYPFTLWIPNMLLRSFGTIGHKSYFPLELISFYQFLFYWMIFLGIFNLIYWRRSSFSVLSLLGITVFYAMVLLIRNYSSELLFGFQQISLAGRYLFPVIGAIYVLVTKVLKTIPIRVIQWISLILTLGLFFYGGPLTIIRAYQTIFSGWFMP